MAIIRPFKKEEGFRALLSCAQATAYIILQAFQGNNYRVSTWFERWITSDISWEHRFTFSEPTKCNRARARQCLYHLPSMHIRHYLSFWATNKWKRSVGLKYMYGYVSISQQWNPISWGVYIFFFYASKLLFTNCWQGSYWRTTKGVLKKSEQRNRRAVPTKIGIVDQSSLQKML